MDNEVYAFALKNTFNEIQSICPDITNAFMLRENGEVIAGDEKTPEKTMKQFWNAFESIMEKAEAIGGIEGMTIEGNNGRVTVSSVNDVYVVTATTRKADMIYVKTVTHVLIPTILKVLEKIGPTPLEGGLPSTETKHHAKISAINEAEELAEEPPEETVVKEPEIPIKAKTKPESLLSEPSVNQLIVENLGGLLVPSDTVRIDSQVLSQWEEFYEGKKIEEVEIGTFDGKTTRCKVKPIKDSKHEGKGVIQMPEKVQLTLEIKKGELVKAKPVVE